MESNLAKIFNFYQTAKQHLLNYDSGWLYDLVNERIQCFENPKLQHHQEIIGYSLENRHRPINIFVIGEGNFGKSSLINAIVGGEVARVNFLPTTWCIHRYLAGAEQAVAYFEDGTTRSFTVDQALRLIDAEEEKQKQNSAYNSSLYQVEWSFSSYPRLQDFIIVDTPGLFQVNSCRMQKSIEEYYYQADAVLWLFDATRINRENSYKALAQVTRFSKKIIGVINKWDAISPASRDRVLEQAVAAFGQYVQSFQPVSATYAFEGLRSGDRQKYEASLLPQLLAKIQESFLADFELEKNRNLYYNACLAFKESGGILRSESETARNNLAIYQANRNTILDSGQPLFQEVVVGALQEFNAGFTRIYEEIQQSVTFHNAQHMVNTVLLDPEKLNSIVGLIYSKAKTKRDRAIYQLVQDLGTKKYQELFYDYDGSILSREQLSNLRCFPEPVPIREIRIRIEIPTNRWHKFKEWFAGTFIGKLFKSVQENVERDQARFRSELIMEIQEHQKEYARQLQDSLASNLTECFRIILDNFDNQFNKLFKSPQQFAATIERMDRQYQLSKLPPKPFANQLVNLLRKCCQR